MKPHLKLASFLILVRIDAYIREFKLRGKRLFDAAPDVCDGAYDRGELRELIRKRLLRLISYSKQEIDYPVCEQCDLCGDRFTVILTDRAIAKFWQSRRQERK